MRVIRADTLGFCPGVRRAVRLAEAAARPGPVVQTGASQSEVGPEAGDAVAGRAYILGQIVHNPTVSANLAAAGAVQITENDSVPPGAVVVIRSHGVTPEVQQRFEAAGAKIVDATCPRVQTNQRAARQFAAEGKTVVVIGDRGHGETISVAAHAPGSVIISTVEQAEELRSTRPLALLAQTTMSDAEYDAIRDVLLRRFPDLADGRGICSATHERQAAVVRLCAQVQAIVVVGGLNSANTRRLAELARSYGLPTWHVESVAGLPPELASYDIVGLTAGASTPDSDIDAVEKVLSGIPHPSSTAGGSVSTTLQYTARPPTAPGQDTSREKP